MHTSVYIYYTLSKSLFPINPNFINQMSQYHLTRLADYT